jgi:DNA-binding transcriptional MerR regulator
LSIESYSISELAREFEITTRSIRFYEEKGLLHPARRGQQRVYSQADRVRLRLILRGKRIGLTLEESREIIGMYQPGQANEAQSRLLLDRVEQRRLQFQQQLEDIRQALAELDEVENKVRDAMAAPEPGH